MRLTRLVPLATLAVAGIAVLAYRHRPEPAVIVYDEDSTTSVLISRINLPTGRH